MGREWNDKLTRKMVQSICVADDTPTPSRMLVTDLDRIGDEPPKVLIELLTVVGDHGSEQVFASFIVKRRGKPRVRRYREETRRWPG